MRHFLFIYAILVSMTGYIDAVVDYTEPLMPDVETIGLWHMNSVSGSGVNKWVSNDPLDTNKEMRIVGIGGNPVAAIVSGPAIEFDNALYLGSTATQEALQSRTPQWNNSYETFKAEFWVKIDAMVGATKNLVEGGTTWFIQKYATSTSAELGLVVRFSDDTTGQVWITDSEVKNLSGQWLHITALFDENQQLSLAVFNQSGTFNQTVTGDYTGKIIKNQGDEIIYALWKCSASIDELRISTVACNGGGYLTADINKDCYVNLKDFAELSAQWMSQ